MSLTNFSFALKLRLFFGIMFFLLAFLVIASESFISKTYKSLDQTENIKNFYDNATANARNLRDLWSREKTIDLADKNKKQ
jgi:hypothetical protein